LAATAAEQKTNAKLHNKPYWHTPIKSAVLQPENIGSEPAIFFQCLTRQAMLFIAPLSS